MSMSEAERDKILKEHEKQMVKLENRWAHTFVLNVYVVYLFLSVS